MDKIIKYDFNELNRWSPAIDQNLINVDNVLKKIAYQVDAMSDGWKQDSYNKFKENMEEFANQIKKYKDAINIYRTAMKKYIMKIENIDRNYRDSGNFGLK